MTNIHEIIGDDSMQRGSELTKEITDIAAIHTEHFFCVDEGYLFPWGVTGRL